MKNETSLDTLCAALCYALGINPPSEAHPANKTITDYIDSTLNGKKVDRLFMYNPDAVAEWIQEKYPSYMAPVINHTDIHVPFATVMPSVTPVCFGTMYTGAQPEVHGIQKYEKPVIKIDTFFDALIRAGKKACIVSIQECSMSKIYLERDMDYFIYPTIEEADAKAAELIVKDEYDVIVVYNSNYDHFMHKFGPEDPFVLAQLEQNASIFATFAEMIKNNWKNHDVFYGFAMDHGCHYIDADCGSHGLDMDEDINIKHHYGIKLSCKK